MERNQIEIDSLFIRKKLIYSKRELISTEIQNDVVSYFRCSLKINFLATCSADTRERFGAKFRNPGSAAF